MCSSLTAEFDWFECRFSVVKVPLNLFSVPEWYMKCAFWWDTREINYLLQICAYIIYICVVMNMNGNTQTATYSSSEAFTLYCISVLTFTSLMHRSILFIHNCTVYRHFGFTQSWEWGGGWGIGHRHTNINCSLIKPLLCSSILVAAFS